MKLLIAAALIVTSAPVVAVAGSVDGDKAQQPKERLICRRTNVQMSQSRLGRGRVCMTRAQWNARGDTSVDDEMSTIEPMARTQGRPELPN